MGDPLLDPARLAALAERGLPDATPEASFDRLTRWAQRGLACDGAYLNFIDGAEHVFKSFAGIDPGPRRMPVAASPCADVVRRGSTHVAGDVRTDPLLREHPIVAQGVRGYLAVPLRTSDGHALGTLCVMDHAVRAWTAEDVELLEELAQVAMTEVELTHSRAVANASLAAARQLAATDPLTGLGNRRTFDDRLEAEVALAAREGRPLALALLDLDGFKAVNDRHGHAAGDAVLVRIANRLLVETRTGELLTRIGGDELALLLPGAGAVQAAAAAERLRAAVPETAPGVTLSAGVGAWQPGMSADDLTRTVDQALYDAKGHGGDRVVAAGPGTHAPRPARRHPPALQALARLAQSPQLDLALDAVNELLGMEIAYATRMDDSEQVLLRLRGDGASFGVGDGTRIPIDETYCHHVLAGRLPNLLGDVQGDPLAGAMAVTQSAGVGAFASVPLRLADGEVVGTLCAASHDARTDLGPRDLAVLHLVARIAAADLDRGRIQEQLRGLESQAAGVAALSAAISARDSYTGEHSREVVALARGVAFELGLDAEEVAEVEHVALLHDVGKLTIPDAILRSPGPLDAEEWAVMRTHPLASEAVVREVPGLSAVATAVRSEHERWDGAGYPDGLREDAIPLAARITLACDAYHAMISDRPYRARLSPAAARAELERCAGTQFDPAVVASLLAVLR